MDNGNNNEQGFVFYHEPDKFEEHIISKIIRNQRIKED